MVPLSTDGAFGESQGRELSVDGISIGVSESTIASMLSSASSRCWLQDDNLTLLTFQPDRQLAVYIDQGGSVVRVEYGERLDDQGRTIIKKGDPIGMVETILGKPNSISDISCGMKDEPPTTMRSFNVSGLRLEIFSVDSLVEAIDLEAQT